MAPTTTTSACRSLAREVRTYLVEQHALAPDRLPFAGKGESQPFDASDPYNGINRRVEFRNLSG